MKFVYQYLAICFIFSPTSNHIHSLQVENCDSNSLLVVDEDNYGKLGLERLNPLFWQTFMQNMMLAYSSKCYSITVVNKVTIFSSHNDWNIQILNLPEYLLSMAMFVLHYLCIVHAFKCGCDSRG